METGFFVYWKQYCFIPSYFCWWELLLKLGGNQFLKKKYIPASEHQFFYIFRDFKIFESGSNFPV